MGHFGRSYTKARTAGYFLPPQGQPDSILNSFSGTFQPPPDPHRQFPEKWPKSTTAAGNCENIMRNLRSWRLKNKLRGKK
jgi:hypothetical protein